MDATVVTGRDMYIVTLVQIADIGTDTIITNVFQSRSVHRSTFASVYLLNSAHLCSIDV